MIIDKLIDDYIKSTELNPKQHKRLKSKIHLLNRFKEFLDEREVTEIGIKEALEYQGWLIEQGTIKGGKYDNSTVCKFITAVSVFYNYLESRNVVFSNPFKYIQRVRVNTKIPGNILDEKDMNKLLEALREWNKEKHLKEKKSLYRMHVIAELMYSTGLRSSEVAKLRVSDIDLDNGLLTVEEGKGGYSRKAILNGYVIDVLDNYINRMRNLIFTENNRRNGDLLFGLAVSSFNKYVNSSLDKICNRLGIKGMRSHGFRHALGYHLLRSGCSIRHIQDILGHKCIRNTEVYTKVDKKDLKKVLNMYHPRIIKRIRDEVNCV